MAFLQQHWQMIALIVGGIIVLLVAFRSLGNGPLPYEKRGQLLSAPEITFLRSLQYAVREDWLIFAMVRLADVIKVRSRTAKSASWLYKIQGKHVDFVICDPETLEVKLAIELDDISSRSPENTSRQRFVATALSAAGIPLMKIRVEPKYEHSVLRKDIEDALGITRLKKKRA